MRDGARDWDMYIGGEWVPADDGDRVEFFDPAKGEVAGTIPRGQEADVDRAVAAAAAAAPEWRATPAPERGRLLLRLAAELRDRADEFAALESLNTGGSLGGSRWTVREVAARRFEFFGGLADKVLGDTYSVPGRTHSFTLREPYGVTAHIVPWNGPLWVGTRSIAPALAAGNTLVVKPSAEASLSLLRLAELATECGFPSGVLNVVTGRGSEAGEHLTGHPGVASISFTGSGATGRRIIQRSAERFIPVGLELGGKSPNIVLGDADLDRALQGALWAIFANAGQICVAGSRLLVEDTIHDEFVERLAEMAAKLRLGGPDMEADMGPLISNGQREQVLAHIEAGRETSRLVIGGGVPDAAELAGGYFVEPTIFDRVPPDAAIAREEIFGPVLAVTPVSGVDEAIAVANDSEYGLAAAVWTRNLDAALTVAERLESGQVYVNHYFTIGFELSRTPYKGSGFGHSEGQAAMDQYLRTKVVSVDLSST
jgi:aldehyde dehydrogenase (NAD+)